MSTRFAFPVGSGTLVFKETSSSTKMNGTDNYLLTAVNGLDDDRVRVEGIIGNTAGQAVANNNYTSNNTVADGTSLITAISALDSGINTNNLNALHLSTTANLTGTITTTVGSGAVVGVGTTFASGDVGKVLVTAGGQARKILTFTDTTHITCDTFAAAEAGVTFFYEEQVNSRKQFLTTPYIQEYIDSLKNRVDGLMMSWTSASTITIGVGGCRDKTGQVWIPVTAPLVIDITASGALGRSEAAAEASSTYYWPYLIMKVDGTVSAVISTVNESVTGSITMPTGYVYKRQLRVPVRNDSGSNIIPFCNVALADFMPDYIYNIAMTDAGVAAATTNVVNGVNPGTSFTDITTVANFVPPGVLDVFFSEIFSFATNAANSFVKAKAGPHNGHVNRVTTNNQLSYAVYWEQCDTSQICQYKVSAAGPLVYLDIKAYRGNGNGAIA